MNKSIHSFFSCWKLRFVPGKDCTFCYNEGIKYATITISHILERPQNGGKVSKTHLLFNTHR